MVHAHRVEALLLLAKGMAAFAQAFGFDYLELSKATTRNVDQTDTSTAVDPAVARYRPNEAQTR